MNINFTASTGQVEILPSDDVCALQFIGSLEIARPTCKIDIITAMRRIRVR
jgi:hypothetical protein